MWRVLYVFLAIAVVAALFMVRWTLQNVAALLMLKMSTESGCT
jgi:hypothetical protein